MAYAYDSGVFGGGYADQTFKSNSEDWNKIHTAYSAGDITDAPNKYKNFRTIIIEMNSAIAGAGIDGITAIKVGPTYGSIIKLDTKRRNLDEFTSGVHTDVETLVDDPFTKSFTELLATVRGHSEMSAPSNEGVSSLEIEDYEAETIKKWLEAAMGQEEDPFEDITDAEVKADVQKYLEYDSSSGKYRYEEALDNWDNLSEKQQTALAYLYESNFRKLESTFDKSSKEYKDAKATLDRMQQHLYGYDRFDQALTVTSAGSGLLDVVKKDKNSHSKEVLQGLNDAKGQRFVCVNANGDEIHGTPDMFHMSFAQDKAGIKLTLRYGIGEYHVDNTSEIAYHTSLSRSLSYVQNQEKKNPGCYDYLKRMGYSEKAIASMLTSADNTSDMTVLDKLTKSTGDYAKVFTVDASKLSKAGNDEILKYVVTLQAMYSTYGGDKYVKELDAINNFYSDADNSYSAGYFNQYFELVKSQMTEEQLINLWTSTDYVMTEEECERAKVIVKERLGNYQRSSRGYITHSDEEKAEVNQMLMLQTKASTWLSGSAAFARPIVNLTWFLADCTEDLIGTGAEIASTAIDGCFGTDTYSAVMDYREFYKNDSEAQKAYFEAQVKNANTQHPGAYAIGSFSGNMLLYMATAPIFGGLATAAGVTGDAGVFIVNQFGQNAQDLLLDTRPLYEELTADGDFSTEDKIKVAKNIGWNATFNLGMGGAEAAYDAYKAGKIANIASSEADSILKSDMIPDMLKNTNTTPKGALLSEEGLKANKIFKGDNFKAVDSFENTVDAAKRTAIIKNNSNLTCPLDANLKGGLKTNPSAVGDGVKDEIVDLRNSVPEITKNTVMQKCIPEEDALKYLSGEYTSVGGCVTKAADAAPFTGNVKQAYENLRLDYVGTPYKELVENGGELYIIRYTSSDIPKNADIPKLNPKYGPPCTESGFLGSSEHLIPEYCLKKKGKITGGAIYKVSSEGSESLLGYWDDSIGHFVEEIGVNPTGDDWFKYLSQTYGGENVKNLSKTSKEATTILSNSIDNAKKLGIISEDQASLLAKKIDADVPATVFSSISKDETKIIISQMNTSDLTLVIDSAAKHSQEAALPILRCLEPSESAEIILNLDSLSLRNNDVLELIKKDIDDLTDINIVKANELVSETIVKSGRELGFSDKVLRRYADKIEKIEYDNAFNWVRNSYGKGSELLSKEDLLLLAEIDETQIITSSIEKKLTGIEVVSEYARRYNDGFFDSRNYTLDDILVKKIDRSASEKFYYNVPYSDCLPRVDEFISDEAVINYVKALLSDNRAIHDCSTLSDITHQLHGNPTTIELVVFQNADRKAGANLLRFNGNLGNVGQSVRSGGGLYAIPEYKLEEFAKAYPDLCSYSDGLFTIKKGSFERFGKDVLSGVSLSNSDGAFMIVTNVPFNGNNISMPSVNNWSAFMDQFVSGGYLLSEEIEVTQKALPDIVSNAKTVSRPSRLAGQSEGTGYVIYQLK